jgi:glycosyltransferase involved in cell wall biosynthesis
MMSTGVLPLLDECLKTCPAGMDCRCVKFAAQYCADRLANPKVWDELVVRLAARDRHLPAIPRPPGWSAAPPAPPVPADPRDVHGAPIPTTADVVYLLNTAAVCGGVRIVFEHLNGLVDRGHDAVLVTADGARPPAGWVDCRFPTISLAEARASGLWHAARVLVATHWSTAAAVAEGAGDGRSRFYFVQSREDWMCPESAAAARQTYTVPGLRPLACNTWVKGWLEGEFGHRDVPVVPQGVSDEFWPELGLIGQVPARFEPPPSPAILIEGHDLNPAKDLATAHAVCAELRHRGLAIEVWGIAQIAEIQQKYKYDRFWLNPAAATMRRVYSGATLLLKTSVFEGRPLAPPEAMACGCPVVATDCRGTDDFAAVAEVRPVGAVTALADACAAILADPERRAAMARAGLERVAGHLRWDHAIPALERLLGLTPATELARGTIGVLLPTRDRPHLIGRALASLQAQTRADWRCVITINGDRDPAGYTAALGPFRDDPRIAVRAIPEEGIPAALNAGLAAIGAPDYIAVLEDDDEWRPEFLQALSVPLDRDRNLMMAYCDLEERGLDAPLTRPPDHGEYDRAIHLGGNWICFPMMLWRRWTIAATGGFDAESGGCCDWDTGLRAGIFGGVRRVRRRLTVHHWHRGRGPAGAGGDQNTCQDSAYMAPGLARIQARRATGTYAPRRPTDRELLQALTPEAHLVRETCPHRHERASCCGPVDACRARGDRRVMTIDCVRCVLDGGIRTRES